MLTEITEPRSPPIPQNQTQKLEKLGLMASSIAHDFNNLLASIMSHASLALMKLPPEDAARSHIEKAIKSAEYATILTYQLRLYTKGVPSEVDLIDLNQLIDDNVGLLVANFLGDAVLRLNLAPHVPPIKAGRGQIQQMIMNLVINAAEAIQPYPGIVTVKTGTHTFLPGSNGSHTMQFAKGRIPLPGEYVYLQVSDTGKGMDEATLAQIFNPFFTTKPDGWGLGLAAIGEIVDSYQGRITVASKLGSGTTFTLFFPCHKNKRSHQHPFG